MLKLSLISLAVGLVLGYGLAPSVAFAHGYVQRFSPPLPLPWYLIAAGAAVVLSFVVNHLIARSSTGTGLGPSYFLRIGQLISNSTFSSITVISCRFIVLAIQIVSVTLLAVILTAGFAGDQNPIRNIAPTFVWVIFWVGVPILCATVGNVWRLFNPWELLFLVALAGYQRTRGGRRGSPLSVYRTSWDVWPAVFLFLAFAWIENIYPNSIIPSHLAAVITIYSVITWAGMVIFGRHAWLRYADPFSVLFRLLSLCSIVEPTVSSEKSCQKCPEQCRGENGECRNCVTCFLKSPWKIRAVRLRIFGSGVIQHGSASTAATVFILLVLSTMTLDGFLATTTWTDIRQQLIVVLPNVTIIGSVALLGTPVLFYLSYQLFMVLTSFFGKLSLTSYSVGRIFAITLLPIAVAYHIAHFHYFLLIQGQTIIPLISDPFGFGWNLFGTTDYRINVMMLNPNVSWLFTVVVIVLGHVTAVYSAHAIATRHLNASSAMIRAQTPVLALMTSYTVLSLWVMGQPMIG